MRNMPKTSLMVPMARSRSSAPVCKLTRPTQSFEMLCYFADASILNLTSRALNDLYSTFGNLFPHGNPEGYAH